ncbi:MAG: hypothetical protein ACOH1Y_08305 [Propionicimonas sp.]
MEIIEYLRIARGRKWVLIGVPVLAAAATSGIILTMPLTYSATSTVSPAALVGGATGNQYNGSQAVSQFVAAFQATALGPAVTHAVAEITKLPPAVIDDGLAVEQVGASSAMRISYTDTKEANVEPTLTAVTKQTLKAMFGTQVDLAQTQVDNATAEISSAANTILAWEKQTGLVDPDRLYQSKIDQINSMASQQLTLAANGNSVGAAATAAALATARASLASFGPLLAQYHVLTARQDAARAALTQALQNHQQAKAQLGAADPSAVTFIGTVQPSDNKTTLLTTVLPVTGASLFAAIAVVAILELLSRNRAIGSPSSTGTRPGSHSPGRIQKPVRQPNGQFARAEEADADADADADASAARQFFPNRI